VVALLDELGGTDDRPEPSDSADKDDAKDPMGSFATFASAGLAGSNCWPSIML
jgi:hypothetical protein